MSPKSGAIRGLSARDLPDKPAVKGSEKLYSAIVMPQCVLYDSLNTYCIILQYYVLICNNILLNITKTYLTYYILYVKGNNLLTVISTTVKKYTF